MSKTIRVLLVDDCPALCVGLRRLLEQATDVVILGEVSEGTQVLAQIEVLLPDVVVLDCRWPGMNGVEIVAEVREKSLPTKVLAFSAYDDETYVRGMVDAGAVGYLLKNEPPERIVEAVRTVARGECWFSPKIAALIAAWARGETLPRKMGLTEREREVLRFVTQGLSNKEIGQMVKVKERTVEFHVGNILKKLGVSSRVQVALWDREHGVTSS